MPDILILADDLSGAADCGIACVKFGLDAAVSLGAPGTTLTAHTIAVDADTRILPAAAAAARMFDLARAWASDPATLLFKKIDSTLRGHLGPELAAVLAARRINVPHPIAVMAPAFPAIGRTTRDGLHFVHGQPLHLTDMWRNEQIAGDSHIPSMLSGAGLRCTHLDLQALHALGRPAPDAFASSDVLLCDAADDADLRVVAEIAAALGPRAIWVGSAGLAYHLPHAAGFVSSANSPLDVMHFAPPPTDRPTLFVLGSTSRRTWDQATVLLSSSDIHGVVIPPETLLAGPATADWQAFAQDLYSTINAGLDVVLLCDSQPRVAPEDRPTLSLALAEMTANLRDRVGTLIASGGETARKVLDRWGVRSMELHGELETGVPISSANLGPDSTITIITKAGDFGQPETLLRALLWAQQATPRQSTRDSHPPPATHSRGLPAKSVPAELPRRVAAGKPDRQRPIIALTMGDAAGVGPEIIMKSLANPQVHRWCRPVVVGDAARLSAAGHIVQSSIDVQSIDAGQLESQTFHPDTIACIDLKLIPADLPWGKLSPIAGDAAFHFIEQACSLAMQGRVDAICTAPINKEALHAGGHRFPGHTELLAVLTHTPEVSMMLSTLRLKVTHVTTHIGLVDAIARIEPGLVERTITRAHTVLTRAGNPTPRIGVCGINPHAGENGLFGHGEEASKIAPAIALCRARGWHVEGPLPADTLFFLAQRGDYDMVIAMYHDQGHGPVKVLGLESGVNITIGLPVIRTSVDHGTAFDIAGTGKADERSMIEAIRQAAELAVTPFSYS